MKPPRYLTDGERRRILRGLDLAAVAAAFAVSLLETPGAISGDPVAWGILARYVGWLAGLWALWALMAQAFRAYEGRVRASPWRSAVQLTKAGLVGGGLFLAVGIGPGDLALENSPAAAGLFLGLAVAFPVAGRLLYRVVLGRSAQRRPTLGKAGDSRRASGRRRFRRRPPGCGKAVRSLAS